MKKVPAAKVVHGVGGDAESAPCADPTWRFLLRLGRSLRTLAAANGRNGGTAAYLKFHALRNNLHRHGEDP